MEKHNLPEDARHWIFEDPQSENFECAMGAKHFYKYLSSGRLRKCFVFLSSVSLYCRGDCYIQKLQQKRQKRTVEYRIDISDISRVNYVHCTQVWLFVLCLLFGLLAPAILVLDRVTGFGAHTVLNPLLDAGLCILLAIFFALQYALRKKKLLQFTYSNGTIAVDTKYFDPKDEVLLVKRLNVLRREAQERG